MNSTHIFAFLRPKTITTKVAKITNDAITASGSYIDRMIAAIRLSKDLSNTNQTPTDDQVATLNAFFGYGKASEVFEEAHSQHEELKQAFDHKDHFDIARKGVLHSYYTPNTLVDAMWRALCRLGATEGRVIEPACGSGQFIQNKHSLFEGKFYGVELDPTVGTLARQINHHACGEIIPIACVGDSFKVQARKQKGSQWNIELIGHSTYRICEVGSTTLCNTGRKVFNRILEKLIDLRSVVSTTNKDTAYAKQRVKSCVNELSKPFKYELELETMKKTIRDLEVELANEKNSTESKSLAA